MFSVGYQRLLRQKKPDYLEKNNTFETVVVAPSSPQYAGDKDRFNRSIDYKIQYQKDRKERYRRLIESKTNSRNVRNIKN